MTEKHPTSGKRPATENRQPAGRIHLDHGVSSLVAQDSPDDPQLGAPDPAGREKPTGKNEA
ncbi:MAG: hypothetical protein ACOY93_06385 [Bacillota bacterium]